MLDTRKSLDSVGNTIDNTNDLIAKSAQKAWESIYK